MRMILTRRCGFRPRWRWERTTTRRSPALLRIARRDAASPWMRSAVLCSCAPVAERMLIELWDDAEATRSKRPSDDAIEQLLEQLALVVGARNQRSEIERVYDYVAMKVTARRSNALRDLVVVALARGARRSGGRLPVAIATAKPGSRLVSDVIGESAWTALDDQSSEAVRARAIARLVVLDPAGAPATLVKLFEPREPVAIQARAVRALAECERADAAKILLPRLRAFEPPVKGAAIATLLTRAAWTKSLLEAIGKSDPASGLGPALIEPADRALLLKHRNVEIGQLAQKLFGQAAPSARATVIADYMAAMRVKGDRDRGARVFERECKTCHKIGDAGFALGPDLTGSPSRDPAALLANILDPNASVPPKDVQYVVVDQNGRSYSGIIASQTASSITVLRGEGARDTILRGQVAELTSTGLSLMPEGFEKRISKPEMADLIAFLCAAHRGGDGSDGLAADDSRPLDIGTLPGLIEPDD